MVSGLLGATYRASAPEEHVQKVAKSACVRKWTPNSPSTMSYSARVVNCWRSNITISLTRIDQHELVHFSDNYFLSQEIHPVFIDVGWSSHLRPGVLGDTANPQSTEWNSARFRTYSVGDCQDSAF